MFNTFDEIASVLSSSQKTFEISQKASTKDFARLTSLMQNLIELDRFGLYDLEIDLTSFDWVSGHENRNWWWQLQALPFLRWYITSYDLLVKSEQKAFEFVLRAFLCWIDKSKEKVKSPLMWHDHASALRLRNIVDFINFIVSHDEANKVSEDDQVKILKSIKEHIKFLCLKKNYSKHTNHGYDQVDILYRVCLLWKEQDSLFLSEVSKLAYSRLKDELDFAFTDEGVHVENSPHYQKHMSSRLNSLILLKEYGDDKISTYAAQLKEKALAFLRAITLPNGYLPMIGDTEGNDKGLQVELSNGIKFYDYSKSGYYIAKGLTNDGKAIQMIFKCTHLSNYHRHDDDLSFLLFYDEEVIFGDGGLGFYEEKDERRKFLRSAAAHNTVVLPDIIPIRNNQQLSAMPQLTVKEPGLIIGESSMYGGRLRRTLDLRELSENKFTIEDQWLELPESAQTQRINFFLPYPARVSSAMKKIHFRTPNKSPVYLTMNHGHNAYIETGWERGSKSGVVVSKLFSQFKNATVFGWTLQVDKSSKSFVKVVIGDKN